MSLKKTFRALAVAGAMMACAAAQAQVVVVVNAKSPIASMTAEEVSAIFLGKTGRLPSGATAAPADLPEGAAAREAFYSKVAGKSAAQVKATWARLTFSGKATPPREFSTSADARRHVAGNPDAIAYIEASAVDASVKVVLTVN